MSKTIDMVFRSGLPTKKVPAGVKYVLFKVIDANGVATYDWGMSEWDGKEWGYPEIPIGYTATVAWWADTLHPDVLLVEPSKIIKLNGLN